MTMKSMNQTQLSNIINITHKAQYAILSEEEKQNTLKQIPEYTAETLAQWLNAQNNPSIARAWQKIYQGEWQQAQDELSEIDLAVNPSAALAYARIAIRHGKNILALNYLKYAIKCFRSLSQDMNLAKAHGLLGELLIRQGLVKKALQHMQIAYNLTPQGHWSRQRQYSYLALPLARLGQVNLANEHYMRAFFMAINENDKEGQQYALVRSAALFLYGDDTALEQAKKFKTHYDISFSGVVLGYWNALLFMQSWLSGDYETHYLIQAKACFKDIAPLEYYYLSAVCEHKVYEAENTSIETEGLDVKSRVSSTGNIMGLDDLPIADITQIDSINSAEKLKSTLHKFFV